MTHPPLVQDRATQCLLDLDAQVDHLTAIILREKMRLHLLQLVTVQAKTCQSILVQWSGANF